MAGVGAGCSGAMAPGAGGATERTGAVTPALAPPVEDARAASESAAGRFAGPAVAAGLAATGALADRDSVAGLAAEPPDVPGDALTGGIGDCEVVPVVGDEPEALQAAPMTAVRATKDSVAMNMRRLRICAPPLRESRITLGGLVVCSI
jgi:hypothetical protein